MFWAPEQQIVIPGSLTWVALRNDHDKVVPELRKREIFRREYEGRTLRENLGLPRPKNRFFEARWAGIVAVFARKTLTLGSQKLGCAPMRA
jgi:hypothetical protein